MCDIAVDNWGMQAANAYKRDTELCEFAGGRGVCPCHCMGVAVIFLGQRGCGALESGVAVGLGLDLRPASSLQLACVLIYFMRIRDAGHALVGLSL